MTNKELLLHYLRLWKNEWRTGFDLRMSLSQCDQLGTRLFPPAEFRMLIAQLRLEGNLIVAGPKGYMLTDNIDFIGKYVKSRWGELTREMKVLKAMDRACNGIDQWTLCEYNKVDRYIQELEDKLNRHIAENHVLDDNIPDFIANDEYANKLMTEIEELKGV